MSAKPIGTCTTIRGPLSLAESRSVSWRRCGGTSAVEFRGNQSQANQPERSPSCKHRLRQEIGNALTCRATAWSPQPSSFAATTASRIADRISRTARARTAADAATTNAASRHATRAGRVSRNVSNLRVVWRWLRSSSRARTNRLARVGRTFVCLHYIMSADAAAVERHRFKTAPA